jgi:RNA polymerase sigma-70 factor (ECF subfamily)
LEALCRAYWPPLYAYVRRDGHSPEEAQDLVQAFIAHLLRRNDLATVSPEKGRFRSFLLTALKHFIVSTARAQNALKRGGGQEALSLQMDNAETLCGAEMADQLTPDKAFDRRWAQTLLARALEQLHREHGSPQQQRLFRALEPSLTEGGRVRNEAALAAELGVSTGALAAAASRLRQRYRALLEREVAETLANPTDLAEELRALREAWS